MFSWRRVALRRSVIINLKSDKVFKGVLWSKNGPLLVLKQATLLEVNREPVSIDGEIIVERSNVDFIQVLEGTRGDRSK